MRRDYHKIINTRPTTWIDKMRADLANLRYAVNGYEGHAAQNPIITNLVEAASHMSTFDTLGVGVELGSAIIRGLEEWHKSSHEHSDTNVDADHRDDIGTEHRPRDSLESDENSDQSGDVAQPSQTDQTIAQDSAPANETVTSDSVASHDTTDLNNSLIDVANPANNTEMDTQSAADHSIDNPTQEPSEALSNRNAFESADQATQSPGHQESSVVESVDVADTNTVSSDESAETFDIHAVAGIAENQDQETLMSSGPAQTEVAEANTYAQEYSNGEVMTADGLENVPQDASATKEITNETVNNLSIESLSNRATGNENTTTSEPKGENNKELIQNVSIADRSSNREDNIEAAAWEDESPAAQAKISENYAVAHESMTSEEDVAQTNMIDGGTGDYPSENAENHDGGGAVNATESPTAQTETLEGADEDLAWDGGEETAPPAADQDRSPGDDRERRTIEATETATAENSATESDQNQIENSQEEMAQDESADLEDEDEDLDSAW